jgi:hypothetical protein
MDQAMDRRGAADPRVDPDEDLLERTLNHEQIRLPLQSAGTGTPEQSTRPILVIVGAQTSYMPGSSVASTEPHELSSAAATAGDTSNPIANLKNPSQAVAQVGDRVEVPTCQLGSFVPSGSRDQPSAHPTTRLHNNIKKPKVYTDGTIRYAFLTTSGEPESSAEALSHEKWRGTLDEEYKVLMKNGTWHLVPTHHASNIVNCKWVYKIKRKQYGPID